MNKVILEVLYFIDQEIQENEMVEKIVWNDNITDQIEQLLNNENQIQVLGLYGTQDSVKEYFNDKIGLIVQENKDIKNWQKRGMVCWVYCQNIHYFSFIANEKYFTKDLAEESSEVILYRFLRDLCPKIIILPTLKIINGWKDTDQPFYQPARSRPRRYNIEQTDDTQLSTSTINFHFDDKLQINNFVLGQGNIKCVQLQAVQNDQLTLTDKEIEDIFLYLLRKPENNIYDLDLNRFSNQIQQVIREHSMYYKQKIDEEIYLLHQQFQEIVSKQSKYSLHWFENKLKANSQLFQTIHNILFPQFQNLLDLYHPKLDNRKIEQKTLTMMEQQDYEGFLFVNKNIRDLQNIIQQYYELFKEQCVSHDSIIRCLFSEYKQQLKLQISQIKNQQDLFIDLLLYEFKYITQRDNNQQSQCRLELSKKLKISLSNIIDCQYIQNFKIQYFLFNQKTKQTMIVLQNNMNSRIQYNWINANKEIKSKQITQFDQNQNKPLIFYYDISTTTMFVFNTKLGIQILQYNENRELITNDKFVHCILCIEEICYLKYYECFIILDKKLCLSKWLVGDKDIQKLNLNSQFKENQNKSTEYLGVMSSGTGNYFLLSNYQKCDIYNFNNQCVEQIIFKNYNFDVLDMSQLQLFSNEQDWFICLIDNLKQIAIQIKNLSSSQRIVSQTVSQKIKISNQLIDLIKGSSIKFGPIIHLQTALLQENFHFIKKEYYERVINYFTISEFDPNDKLQSYISINEVQPTDVKANVFYFNLISRISIQLCTIEQQLLIPLCDGLRIKYDQFRLNDIRILDKIEQIQFGILERLLYYQNQNVYIISIMGRQSSGKSYLLNRIFGTRFGVSSARCTDGIWLGVSKINDKIFLLLDCEGLFSSRRTPDEETMLLAFLSSISDITILNQDLTFSRNLNELFENLSKSIDQIRGEKLFKGELTVAVRDVFQVQSDGAEKELHENMQKIITKQQTGNFLSKLFNNNYTIFMMSYFDTKSFDQEINELRRQFLENAQVVKRWKDQKQLIRSMKIMLVQIEVKDHRSLEDHELEFMIKAIKRKAEDLWFKHQQKGIEAIQFDHIEKTFMNLLEFAQQKCGQIKSSLDHNQKLNDWNKLIQTYIKNRQNEIFQIIKQEIEKQVTALNKDKFEILENEIKQYLTEQSNLYQICPQRCGSCFLQCKERIFHDSSQKQSDLQEQLKKLNKNILEESKNILCQDSIEKQQENLSKQNQELDIMNISLNYRKINKDINTGNQRLELFCKQGKIIPNELDSQLLRNCSYRTLEILQNYFPVQIKEQLLNNQIQSNNVKVIQNDIDEIASEMQDQKGSMAFYQKPHTFESKLQQFSSINKNLANSRNQEQQQFFQPQKPSNELNQLLCNIQNLEKSKKIILDKNQKIILDLDEDKMIINKNQLIQKIVQMKEQIRIKTNLRDQKIQLEQVQKEIESFNQQQSKQHNCCSNNHQCDQFCQGCKDQQILCKLLRGHIVSENKNHLCQKKEHFCMEKCSIQGCQKSCQNIYQHLNNIKHDCLTKHVCPKQCQFCDKKCEEDIKAQHKIHKCSISQCTQKCFFGLNYFSEDKKCTQICTFNHSQNHPYHTCDRDSHQCYQKCSNPGTCQISLYTESVQNWVTQTGNKFEYKCFKQNAQKLQCQTQIEKKNVSHSGPHICNEKQHICDQRCPECEAICTKPFGHVGKHSPHLHRNKNQQIFTALEGSIDTKILIKEEGEQEREFSIGESCEPETCTRSCARRSRAHYHLIECQGGNKCYSFLLNKNNMRKIARHQTIKYKCSNKIYDEVLCENYWDALGWQHPVEKGKQRNQIPLCNYYCSLCGEIDKQFCTKEAWHTDSSLYADHTFICNEQHKGLIGIDIQFIIDTTGSMEMYIENVKVTVEKLMDTAKQYIKDDLQQIQFSIVSYKDHCDNPVVQSIDFGSYDLAVQFLKSLKVNGGGDYPEAMLDGLNNGAQKKWRQNTKKFSFILADSPPHGVPKFHNNKDDKYPEGCPCKLTEEVLEKFAQQKVEVVILKLNENLNQTIGVFQKVMPSLVVYNKLTNEQFIQKIEKCVCKQLQIREITLRKI